MDLPIRDVSIDKLLVDTSLIFFDSQKKLPQETFLPDQVTDLYTRTVQLLLLISARSNQFSAPTYHQFSLFLSYIVKSTLYFHYCFDHPIAEANSKLALMYGDLYLVKGGERFVEIKNYLRLHPSFRELLYSISMSQRIQVTSKDLTHKDFEKIITSSYGYIFRFALLSPYVYTKNQSFEKRQLTYLSTYVSLFLAWNIEPFIHSQDQKEEKTQELLEKIRLTLREEKYHEYNFDGWKDDIQKASGGNVPKN